MREPGLVERRAPDFLGPDHIEADRLESDFHGPGIVDRLGELPVARQVVVRVDANDERRASEPLLGY